MQTYGVVFVFSSSGVFLGANPIRIGGSLETSMSALALIGGSLEISMLALALMGGSLETAISAASFNSMGLSIITLMANGFSVVKFKLTVRGHPDNMPTTGRKNVNLQKINGLFIEPTVRHDNDDPEV
jgi:hypothetical protein